MNDETRVVPFPKTPAGAKCPLCGKATEHKYRPFCSRRCADIDLGRWLKGTYRIPTDEAPDSLEETMQDRSHDPD